MNTSALATAAHWAGKAAVLIAVFLLAYFHALTPELAAVMTGALVTLGASSAARTVARASTAGTALAAVQVVAAPPKEPPSAPPPPAVVSPAVVVATSILLCVAFVGLMSVISACVQTGTGAPTSPNETIAAVNATESDVCRAIRYLADITTRPLTATESAMLGTCAAVVALQIHPHDAGP